MRVAVIGSGISGLTTSFYLKKGFDLYQNSKDSNFANSEATQKKLQITMFEKNNAIGGWVRGIQNT